MDYWKNLKYWEKLLVIIFTVYALAGFFLTSIFFAIRFHLTDDPGAVTFNDRKFENFQDGISDHSSGIKANEAWIEILDNIIVLNHYYPYDASNFLQVMAKEQDLSLLRKMFFMAEPYLQQNVAYQKALKHKSSRSLKNSGMAADTSLYPWINTVEWKTLSVALQKEYLPLDSVAQKTGINSRLLAAMLIGEQIRLFDSKREAFKKWISPLKILVNETKISLGVMGVKEETAIKIENYLKDKQSVFYLGPDFENMLDFKTSDISKERFDRLTNPKDHTYPYLYAAIYLRQVMQQWKSSGYDISNNPGILATLFNLGFPVSLPKPDPRVGGSRVMVDGNEYTFGSLAEEFYYSGELAKEFPFTGYVTGGRNQ